MTLANALAAAASALGAMQEHETLAPGDVYQPWVSHAPVTLSELCAMRIYDILREETLAEAVNE